MRSIAYYALPLYVCFSPTYRPVCSPIRYTYAFVLIALLVLIQIKILTPCQTK